jgi:hypothetical protein
MKVQRKPCVAVRGAGLAADEPAHALWRAGRAFQTVDKVRRPQTARRSIGSVGSMGSIATDMSVPFGWVAVASDSRPSVRHSRSSRSQFCQRDGSPIGSLSDRAWMSVQARPAALWRSATNAVVATTAGVARGTSFAADRHFAA